MLSGNPGQSPGTHGYAKAVPLGVGPWNSVNTKQTTVSGIYSPSVLVVVEFVHFTPRAISCWQFNSLQRLDKHLSGAAFLRT